MKALKYILVGLVAAGVIGLLCYQGFVTQELTSSNLMRAILILAGLILALFRSPRKRRVSQSGYKAAYGHLIGSAFADAPKLEKKFYAVLADFNNSRYPAALQKLEQLRLESPRAADRFAVHTFTGLCYDRLARYEDAISQYAAALSIREHSTVASNMGSCYLNLGRTNVALECFFRAVRADNRNPNAYNNIAQLYIQLGEYEDAIEYAEQALAINAKMPQALNAMAICWAMLDDDEQSDAYFRRAVANGSDGKVLRNYINNLKA
ncbi:MAG: tetratricopeptide repeat protein [Oscillospiraceae bacterium]|nr:tetratricopeptide repeat protein [Oscillospiraceae bacterium]